MTTTIARPTTETGAIAALERARTALMEAKSVKEVKAVRDMAETARQLCKKARLGLEIQNEAARVKLDAERKAGVMLADMKLRGGDRKSNLHDASLKLEDLGIESTQSHRWQRLSLLPDDEYNDHVERCVESGKELTTADVAKLAKKHAATKSTPSVIFEPDSESQSFTDLSEIETKFKTVYADPPWQYSNQATRASTDNHYSTMTVADICALPIASMVEPKALLFLWTTNGFLRESFSVMDAWGFEFKSSMVWVKPQMGIGNYVRNAHEFLLIGSRGGMRTAAAGRSQISWIQSPRGKHSAKPLAFHGVVEKLSEGPRIELFARNAMPGWTAWGNQISPQRTLGIMSE